MSTIASVRRARSGWPWGRRFRCASLAAVKSWPAPFGHAATHAPQPMQAAASIARSASSLGTGIRFASGAEPVGGAPDGNITPIPKGVADAAMDAAACIGCGACVAACPNGAAQLFTAAKLQHLNLLPQGQAERWDRTVEMVETMESYFGSCTNHRECEAACPKSISIDFIALMNRDYAKAQLSQRRLVGQRFP